MSVRMISNVRTVPGELLKFSKSNNEAAFYLSKSRIAHTSPKTLIECYSNIRLIGDLIKDSNLNLSRVELNMIILAMVNAYKMPATSGHKSLLLSLLHPSERLGFGYKNIKVKFIDHGSVLYKNINMLTEKRLLGDIQIGKNINFIYNGKLVNGQVAEIYSILVKAAEIDEEQERLFHMLFGALPLNDDLDLQSRAARVKAEQEENDLFHYVEYLRENCPENLTDFA